METALNSFPFADVDEVWANTISLMAQNREILNNFHLGAERSNRFFKLAHVGIVEGLGVVIDSDELLHASDIGLQVYEVVGNMSQFDVAATDVGEQITYENARRFQIQAANGNIPQLGTAMYGWFQVRVPKMFEAVYDITGAHVGYNEQATSYAVTAAAMMHGMHRRTVQKTAEAQLGLQ
jgi:hypothetical protein